MCLDGNERDIIIVTGCNAVGKTTASNYLRKLATDHKIPHENKGISDSQCLFEAMREDDAAGGLHHTHDWCPKDAEGHMHHLGQPIFPFTVIDGELPDKMRQDFFKKLERLPHRGKLWFVEWAGGVNTNPHEDPISCIDYSYANVNKMLQEGSLPDSWLKRVKAVIHITAEFDLRLSLNAKRSLPFLALPKDLEQGTAFWLKDEKVLRFYGDDDFSKVESLFQDLDVPICTCENDGGHGFYKCLEMIVDALSPSGMVDLNEIPIAAQIST